MLMEPNFSSPANVDASVECRDEPEKYRAKCKELAARANDRFLEIASHVFIPHPDTNPEERMMYAAADEKKAAVSVEAWGDSNEGSDDDEWGSGEEMASSD